MSEIENCFERLETLIETIRNDFDNLAIQFFGLTINVVNNGQNELQIHPMLSTVTTPLTRINENLDKAIQILNEIKTIIAIQDASNE
jgi:hypothetical protein